LAAGAAAGCSGAKPNDVPTGPSPAVKGTKSAPNGEVAGTKAPIATAPVGKRVSNRPANLKGRIFVAEYHNIKAGRGGMFRTADAFRKDLERFYKDGFRPVTVDEYLSGKMPIPPGSSPVVFTFDDGDPTQYWILKDGSVDPNCAVGMWQDFAKAHPDFPLKATFYILPNPFRQPALVQQKLKYLLSTGSEIGNHTITHRSLRKLTDEAVEKEIGDAQLMIEKLGAPPPTSLAYPYGESPKNKTILPGFTYQGQPIKLRSALLVGAEPARPADDPKFNPYRIPRIQANAEPSGLDDWLKQFEAGNVKVYVQP
jgi:peptidoglycan/xylan/chitin deacetylase (PgdA/CDA1 family)